MTTRADTQAWVRAVLDHRRMKPTELARAIGRAPSTLNRFLNDPTAEHDLSKATVERIADVAGVRPFEMPSPDMPRRRQGLAEPEAEPYVVGSAGADEPVDNGVRAMMRARIALSPFVLRSVALIGAGYLPGDVLVVDLNERAKPRDVVCAQVYDWTRGRADTIFRLYEPPYLIASTSDAALARPVVVDDDAVIIKGVVMWSLRPRRLAEMAA